MQDQRIQNVDEDAQIEEAIMGLLLADHGDLWSVDEIARELADEIAAADGLSQLSRAGLVHRLDGFVLATRAARRAADLALG